MAAYSYKRLAYRDDVKAEIEAMKARGDWDEDDVWTYHGCGLHAAANLLEQKDARIAELEAALRPFAEHARNVEARDGLRRGEGEPPRDDAQTRVPLSWFWPAERALGREACQMCGEPWCDCDR